MSSPFSTAELRWFYEGAIPEDVTAWFHRGERRPVEQLHRVDHYLWLGGLAELGIKLRQGRIEVKRRHTVHGVVHFHRQISGSVEEWHKWSFALAAAHRLPGDAGTQNSAWIKVRKERQLRKYRITNERQPIAVPDAEYPVQGCHLELTRIRVGENRWWSLGLEAFGPAGALWQYLSLVVDHILGQGLLPTLEARHSCGYPRWVALVRVRA
jgi:hypothetical protein